LMINDYCRTKNGFNFGYTVNRLDYCHCHLIQWIILSFFGGRN
jgi:hypothetical protein